MTNAYSYGATFYSKKIINTNFYYMPYPPLKIYYGWICVKYFEVQLISICNNSNHYYRVGLNIDQWYVFLVQQKCEKY